MRTFKFICLMIASSLLASTPATAATDAALDGSADGAKSAPSSAATPQPHWSGLPIWGDEAAKRGYQVPLPFGIGATVYSARQPVNIKDLQLARKGDPPVSVVDFLVLNTVDTAQQNISAKFDVLIFPFLDVYALVGYTTGKTNGLIQVPETNPVGILPAELQLNARFRGPTVGGGVTFQGGTKISESPDLTLFGVADVNVTKTDLSFENESLIARTRPKATVFSARIGLASPVGPFTNGAFWIGAMYQDIQEMVAGDVADTNLQFIVIQSPQKPWNALLGTQVGFSKQVTLLIEGGLGARKSILAGLGARF